MFFLRLGYFQNWEKGHLISIGTGVKLRPLRTPRKSLGMYYPILFMFKFPGIGESIYGEESNRFTNTLGETVTIKIQPSAEKTKTLLGRYDLARILD